MIRVRFVHEVNNVLPEKTQWVVIFQVQIPVKILQNVGINICPFVFGISATVYDDTVSCQLCFIKIDYVSKCLLGLFHLEAGLPLLWGPSGMSSYDTVVKKNGNFSLKLSFHEDNSKIFVVCKNSFLH